MNMLEPFHLTGTQLEPGVTLIEASAGTGKTFTIAGIVVRLVLELRLPIDQILAVTYTVGATEELRDRVRKALRDALEDLRLAKSDNEVVAKFLKEGNREQGMRDLDRAVQNFDDARIFTIHGFCQRVLRDYAFETGLFFEMELLTDPNPIFEEAARDFWRRQFYLGPALLSSLAIAEERSPIQWIKRLQQTINHPDLTVLPPSDQESAAEIAKQLEKKFSEVVLESSQNSGAVSQILWKDKGLSRDKKFYRLDKIPQIETNLAAVCADFRRADPKLLKVISVLSKSEIEKGTKKTGQAPKHHFFDLCEDFRVLTSRFFNQLDHEFMVFAGEEIPRRKERLNVLTYDDLLTCLRDALNGQAGETLIKALGSQYGAALIDEFQDTDPIQYEIFSRVFSGEGHYLFFIGDPKQAIYGFRGADVFTYLGAARQASRKFTLSINYRAEKLLLKAVNALFSNVERPFSIEGIEYRPVRPPSKPREGLAELVEGTTDGPLRFRFLSADNPLSQDEAEAQISRAVVADIARLKASRALLGNRPLAFGDMAILVRTNAQAANLQNLLRAMGIRSVLKTEESVFKTREAGEILRLLKAVLEPKRDVLLRTALATSLVGLRSAQIMDLDSNEAPWQDWLEKFLEYGSLWKRQCFIAFFRHLFIDQEVRQRLVKYPGGERSLTNFLHLAELLHGAEVKGRFTPDALCAWLRARISVFGKEADEHQLRLESDDDAVLLATVHKSKGLEYPIVFCPFLWKGAGTKVSEILFHDPAAGYRLTLDLREKRPAPDDHKRLAREEIKAEALRLLYVAVTRAQNRCYVYAGDIHSFDSSPLAHLLAQTPALPALQALSQKAGGTLAVTLIDPIADQTVKVRPSLIDLGQELAARPHSGFIPESRMIASFTSLTSARAPEEPDRDAIEPRQPIVEGELNDLAGFERGLRAGLFLHDVLEQLDFQEPDQIDEIVRMKLAAHGISEHGWREPLSNQVRRLLETPLATGLTLKRIALAERLSEVEFSYPITSLPSRQFEKIFAEHGGPGLPSEFPEKLGRLDFRPVEGFMRGFIDLLFRFEGRYYLVDWKSNWLGPQASDYDEAGIRACMLQHSYILQYHLYTLAADLYLRRRIAGYEYDQQFGGVFYLFFRGLDPATPGRAIFHDRPPGALVEALRQRLVGPQS